MYGGGMSTQAIGLRALKKRQTRENISDHATRLFLERGFDNVTIAEIAAAAQVSKMTVTNYFPRKEDLALDMHDVFVQLPATTVRQREHDPVIGFSGPQFARMIMDSPALVAYLRGFHDDREKALAAVLAEETGAEADDIAPRVAAVLLGGVLRLLFEETVRLTLAGLSNDAIARAITGNARIAFGALEPSLADYATRPAR
jgi:AcrR family transcriptional regulator